MKTSEFIIKVFKSAGIDTVFGIPSFVAMDLLNELDKKGFDINLNAHEQNAAHVAEGYYLATRKPAILSVAVGPGVTNAITGISNAYVESIPMIILEARPTAFFLGRNEYHSNSGIGRSIDEEQMLKSCTKATFYFDNVQSIKHGIYTAIRESVTGRPGPVVISVPPEIQKMEIEITRILKPDEFISKESKLISKNNLEKIQEMFNESKQPLIVFGSQLKKESKEKLKELLQDSCPYATNNAAAGHVPILKNYLGSINYCNSEQVKLAYDEADLILFIGDELRHFEVNSLGGSQYIQDKKLIQVNEFVEEIGRMYSFDFGVSCDVNDFLNRLKLAKKPWKNITEKIMSDDKFCTLNVIQKLPDFLPENATFFADVGNAGYAAITDLRLKDNQNFFTTGKFGVCGWSVGASMGFAYGDKTAVTFNIIGDLSMNMNISELANVKKFKVKSNFVVFNNSSPQNITQDQIEMINKEVQSEMPEISFEKIAEGYGLKYLQITKLKDLEILKSIDFETENYVIEVVVDRFDYPLRD